jgi:lysophospholipase L1-like esterase
MTALLLAAIEFAAGFFLPTQEVISSGRSSDDDTVSATLAWLWINPAPLREDPDFLWRNQPLANRTQLINPQAFGSNAEWTIQNNSWGFRGPEVRSEWSAKNAYRVLCIGDSVTFGFNSGQDDSYPAQLGRILSARFPGKDIEVINAGVPGWTWLQGLRFLERQGLELEPDLVIIGHGVNDQLMMSLVSDAERLEYIDNPSVKRIAKMRSLVGGTNVYRVIEGLYEMEPPPVKSSPGCELQFENHGYCKRVSTEQIEVAVKRAGQLTEASGVDLVVINLDFMKTPAGAAAKKGADAAGITYIDAVYQFEFERAVFNQARTDDLGLIAEGNRASDPWVEPLKRLRRVVYRVHTPDTTASYSARGHAVYSRVEFTFNTALNDEGRNGDEMPGDGVFSGTLTLPMDVSVLSYMFYREDDQEFKPLEPMGSSFGDRQLHVDDLLTTPVFGFAERFRMVEQTHPNAVGYEVIAKSVAYEIGRLPSFYR